MKNKFSKEEESESIAFTSLPMKWRTVCYKYGMNNNLSHEVIIQSRFKIGRFSKTVIGIELP